MSTMTSHLEEERKKLPFNIKALTHFFYGSKENYESFAKAVDFLQKEPDLQFSPEEFDYTRKELYLSLLKKSVKFHHLFNLEELDSLMFAQHLFIEPLPLIVNFLMFIPTIKYLGTDKQQQVWLEPARKLEIIGCYAQTEIGHGSDIQNLETTATYDAKTDEFVIHSPTISSIKFWIGDLGKTATHCITHAQLLINGKNHGVHSFICQVRDLQTHTPMPGVTVGDVGPKMAWNSKDNGYLKFDQVRIPRKNMLMRHAKVTRKGEFVQTTNNPKMAYAAMVLVRCVLAKNVPKALAMATTIAVRYSIERVQFKDDTKQDIQIMNYQTQMNKLIPLVAKVYAMTAGGRVITEMHEELMRRINTNNDFGLLPVIHSLLCGMKAYYTWWTLEGTEKARQACGGHGFSMYSGLPTALFLVYPSVTLEGDNALMAFQTARHLVGALNKVKNGQKLDNGIDDYLNEVQALISGKVTQNDVASFKNREFVRKLLRINSAYNIHYAASKLASGMKSGATMLESWNKVAGISMLDAAEGHINLFTYEVLNKKINTIAEPEAKDVLSKLCTLFGLEFLISKPYGLFQSNSIESSQLELMIDAKEELLRELRPVILGCVDAFALPDSFLKSAIGAYDGKPYEKLWDWINKFNRFNKEDMRKEILEHVAPYRGKKSNPVIVPKL